MSTSKEVISVSDAEQNQKKTCSDCITNDNEEAGQEGGQEGEMKNKGTQRRKQNDACVRRGPVTPRSSSSSSSESSSHSGSEPPAPSRASSSSAAASSTIHLELRLNNPHPRKQVESYKTEICRLGIANSQSTVKHFSSIGHVAANNLVHLLHYRGTPTPPLVLGGNQGISLLDWLMKYGAKEHLATPKENETAREDDDYGLLRLASLQFVFMSHSPRDYRLEFLKALLVEFCTVDWTPCDRLKKFEKMVRTETYPVVQERFHEYITLCTSKPYADDFNKTRREKLLLMKNDIRAEGGRTIKSTRWQ